MSFDVKVDDEPSAKKYFFQFYPEDEVFIAKFNCDVGLRELLDCYSDYVKHPSFIKNMAVCYDFSDCVVDMDVNATELFYQFSTGMRDKRGDSYQLAFVCVDSLTKISVELYRLMLSRTKIDVEIFDNLAIALDWIKETKSMAEILNSKISD